MKPTKTTLASLSCVMLMTAACEIEDSVLMEFDVYVEGQARSISTEQEHVLMLKDFGLTFPVQMQVVVKLVASDEARVLAQEDDAAPTLKPLHIQALQASVVSGGACVIESQRCQDGTCRLTLSAASSGPCVIDLQGQAGQRSASSCFGWYPVDEASGSDNQPERWDELHQLANTTCPHYR